MERSEGMDHSSERRRSAALIAVSAAAVLLVVVAVVVVLIADGAEPSDPVAQDGWSARAALCRSPDAPDVLDGLGRGDVLQLGDDGSELLDAADCVADEGDGAPGAEAPAIDLDATGSSFLVGTGSDRFDVRLVGVEAAEEPVVLRVEVDVPAEGCAVTAEYRGELVLLVGGPADASVPAVELSELARDC